MKTETKNLEKCQVQLNVSMRWSANFRNTCPPASNRLCKIASGKSDIAGFISLRFWSK